MDNPLAKWDGHAITQVLRPADKRPDKPVMGRSIRTERWRYTDWAEGYSGVELYDHASDQWNLTTLRWSLTR
jgi:iduronate 2-sulfatase